MSATYSSFDTLTIGQYEGEAAHGGPMLPVLAEIPAIAAKPAPARTPTPEPDPADEPAIAGRVEPAHASPIATPQFQPAPPAPRPEPVEPPAVAFAPAPETAPLSAPPLTEAPTPTPQPAPATTESNEADWEDGGWAAQLLALEAALRPHARLILLAALIAITGLMLVVLRAPVQVAPETLPSNMVDSSQAPALTNANGPVIVAAEQPTEPADVEVRLEPMPTMPTEPPAAPQTGYAAKAAGPASMPVAATTPAMPSLGEITPIAPHRTASVAPEAPAPAAAEQVRVAELPSYPSTNYTSPSWPATGSAPASSNLPQAQLQRPIKPSSAGMQ